MFMQPDIFKSLITGMSHDRENSEQILSQQLFMYKYRLFNPVRLTSGLSCQWGLEYINCNPSRGVKPTQKRVS